MTPLSVVGAEMDSINKRETEVTSWFSSFREDGKAEFQ